MYPNLRYVLYDWTGLDLPVLALAQSSGFFLIAAFMLGHWLLYLELCRREQAGLMQGVEMPIKTGQPLNPLEVALQTVLAAAIGYKLVDAILHPGLYTGPAATKVVFSISQGSWWGALLFAVAFVAWKIRDKQKELKKHPKPEEIMQYVMPHDRMGDIVVVAAVSGLLGAKLCYVLEFSDWNNLGNLLLSSNGLNAYGGLVFISIALPFWAYRKKIALLRFADSVALILPVAYGVVCLGAHLSGDGSWGIHNPQADSNWLPDYLWAYSYPNNVTNAGIPMQDCLYPISFGDYCSQLPAPVYPVAIWEFIISSLGFCLFWSLRNRVKIEGLYSCAYLVLIGSLAFFMEFIRPYEGLNILGLKIIQVIALMLFLTGLAGIIFFLRKQFAQKETSVQEEEKSEEEKSTIDFTN